MICKQFFFNIVPPGGVFFCQQSFILQHTSAIFEWVYCMLIMLFYGTFAFEFSDISGDTLMVLSKGAKEKGFAMTDHKAEMGRVNQPDT